MPGNLPAHACDSRLRWLGTQVHGDKLTQRLEEVGLEGESHFEGFSSVGDVPLSQQGGADQIGPPWIARDRGGEAFKGLTRLGRLPRSQIGRAKQRVHSDSSRTLMDNLFEVGEGHS